MVEGTPKKVAKERRSFTGHYLAPLLGLESVAAEGIFEGKQMRMVRTANVHLDTKSDVVELLSLHFNDANVTPLIGYRDVRGAGVLVSAQISLSFTPKISKGLICPDTKCRIFLEDTIEHYANFASVHLSAGRLITSPSPCVAFVPDCLEDRDVLMGCIGVRYPKARNPSIRVKPEAPIMQMVEKLQDRLDGVALLAELISSKQPTGKFRESIRVFERAFSIGGYRLVDKLVIALQDHPGGYSKDEILSWVKLRDAMTHADKRNHFAFEKDAILPANRAESAAYYIALNKEKWRSEDCNMRSIWRPTSGSWGTDGGQFITAGEASVLSTQIFDDFGVFLLDLVGGRERKYPSDWWTWPYHGVRGTGPVKALPPRHG
ncbi:MAG: hypothetical protein ABW048_02370 [Sphingobium sp.]